jgi:hypothetical protein
VVLWAALSSAASFTDPSDGTFAHPRHVVIELSLRGSSTLCVHYACTSSVNFVSARVVPVVSPLCSVRTRWACLYRSEGACLRSWIGLVCVRATLPCARLCLCLHALALTFRFVVTGYRNSMSYF